jgi:16S rRNA (cytosine1402-N4)-methyltransferase
MNRAIPHIPVMVNSVLAALTPSDGGIYVDGTFGAGGYSRALLESSACRVVGIDRDPTAIANGQSLAAAYPGRLTLIEGRFGDMDSLLEAEGVIKVDGVALDLGVSSMQLDQAERGFSFAKDGPLDMRMGRDGESAADVVNSRGEAELADIIFQLGEERHSRRVARAIVAGRPFTRTSQLAEVVRRVVPRSSREGIDSATRTFQALRIYVNDEMGEVRRGLSGAEKLLKSGGKLAVVSFHSLEDRLVKDFLKERSGAAPQGSRHLPPNAEQQAPSFTGAKKQEPSREEISANPRARSARLRYAIRTAEKAWGLGGVA